MFGVRITINASVKGKDGKISPCDFISCNVGTSISEMSVELFNIGTQEVEAGLLQLISSIVLYKGIELLLAFEDVDGTGGGPLGLIHL